MTPVIFLPHGNISFGKLAQALEYGALTLQVEANFDQILALVRVLAERTGIYLLNSMNPFRLEGQKTIMFELLDQRDWRVPDWIVLPGGNLGNISAFGKALRGTDRGVEVDMGVGQLDMDLRGVPKHSYDVRIHGGIGEATVRVSADAG